MSAAQSVEDYEQNQVELREANELLAATAKAAEFSIAWLQREHANEIAELQLAKDREISELQKAKAKAIAEFQQANVIAKAKDREIAELQQAKAIVKLQKAKTFAELEDK